MQSKGFEILANKAKDTTINKILQRLSTEEKNNSMFWLRKIYEFDKNFAKDIDLPRKIKTNLIYHVLGPKGFFIWTINGETEAL